MTTFALWYDNGTGHLDADKLVTANTPQEALAQAGEYDFRQVVTSSWKDDPNIHEDNILLDSIALSQNEQAIEFLEKLKDGGEGDAVIDETIAHLRNNERFSANDAFGAILDEPYATEWHTRTGDALRELVEQGVWHEPHMGR